jgi:multidrug efflux pump subunit AcrA (membrane-fusion protein)
MNCDAEIPIETRRDVLAIPLAALTTRAGETDVQGNYLAPLKPARRLLFFPGRPAAAAAVKGRGKQKKLDGVFLMGADRLAHFRPVKIGIMGDMNVEIQDGLKEGETVITGPLESLRQIQEWSWVGAEK